MVQFKGSSESVKVTIQREWCYLTVVGWELVQQLFDAVSLPRTVHIRHPVLWQAAKILVNLCAETSVFISRP